MPSEKLMVIAIMLTVAFGPHGRAQPLPPARIGNVWGGTDHQPTRNAVRNAELQAHTALNAKKKNSEDNELRRIRHQLLRPN